MFYLWCSLLILNLSCSTFSEFNHNLFMVNSIFYGSTYTRFTIVYSCQFEISVWLYKLLIKMVKCFAAGCPSAHKNSKKKVYLFKPIAKEIVEKWSQVVPRTDRDFGENDYLCAKHFDKKDIIYTEVTTDTLHRKMQPKLINSAIPKFFDFPAQVSNANKPHTVIENTFIIKTKKTCAACSCSEILEKDQKNSYYLFPKNPELRKQWISAAQLENTTLSQFTYLCSKHFEENCFESGTLKENAVPSRFGSILTNSNNDCPSSSAGDTESMIVDLTETGSKTNSELFCIVKSCKHEGNIRGITYHRMPTHNHVNWMNALKDFTKVYPIPLDSKVCSMHFKAKDFLIQNNEIKLNSEAVPKLHINESSNIIATNPLSNHETEEGNDVIFNGESNIGKLKQTVLLSSVITPAADIVKSDFALIDINSILNKKTVNEPNNSSTITQNTNNPKQNLTFINTMHNYCNAQVDDNISDNYEAPVVKIINNKVQIETTKPVPNQLNNKNTTIDENDDEDRKRKNILRKLRAYKKAYKRHKSINRKQSDNISILESKLEENTRKNKKLEQRIVILEDLIQNILRKREETVIDMETI